MKKVIYVVGNQTDRNDRLAVDMRPVLQKQFPSISFISFDPTEELEKKEQKKLILLDTVDGISKPTVFRTLEDFSLSPGVSAHDFDLPLQLGILQKLHKIESVCIIGVPMGGSVTRDTRQVVKIIKKLFPTNLQKV